ncbi:hypothetical protein APHAL10511_006691 [Amanita phalloides]|nr:hypothetical protein APHAL10511_006691 [Amanita phalloides]
MRAHAQRLGHFVNNELVRSFSPVYFAIIMGTGGISNLFDVFPYGQGWLMKALSLVLFFLNLSLFMVFTIWAIARYSSHPKDWVDVMHNPTLSLFWGCFPMGFTTIIDVGVNVLHEYFSFGGKVFVYSIWVMWWINLGISFACYWGIVHHMIAHPNYSLELMNTSWLLPVVTLVVCSSSAGILANALREYSLTHALITVTLGLFMVTAGFTLSFIIFTIYFQRLFLYGLPEGTAVLTTFLPLGPTGQAGFSIILIGRNLSELLPAEDSSSAFLRWTYTGQAIYVLCVCVAFLLWTFSSTFLAFAILAIVTALHKRRIGFTPSFWGLVFPNSVYATLTIALGESLNATFFRVYGAIYAVGTFLLWLSITLRSLVHVYDVVFRHPLPAIPLSRTPTLKQVPEAKYRKKRGFIHHQWDQLGATHRHAR